MRRRTSPLAVLVPALMLFVSVASAQQYPIFGCRHAISCHVPPIGPVALNDPGLGGLLVAGSVKWSPGFHFGLVPPHKQAPEPEAEPALNDHGFHLRNVKLLPPEKPGEKTEKGDEPVPAVTPVPPDR